MRPLPAALSTPLEPGARVVEVGIGRRTAVAAALAEAGYDVVATDVREREVPAGVAFRRDDVTEPDRAVYAGAALLYALRWPPELQRPLVELARSVGAACAFTTLGTDPATVPVERETAGDETLCWAVSPGRR
jgi:uncharacterized UPF0146 family protein